MKRLFFILIGLFFLGGCLATQNQVLEIDKRLNKLEKQTLMNLGEGSGADFFPFTGGLDGGGAGYLDALANTEDHDVGFVVLEGNATYGDSFFPYVLDVSGGAGDSLPEYVNAADGSNERWTLCNGIFGGLILNSQTPNDPSPISDVVGGIYFDEDGANETGDVSLRGNDGTNEFLFCRKLKCFHVTVPTPNDLADGLRDKYPIWSNETGMGFTITKIEAWSDTDDTAFVIDEYDADGASNTVEIDAVNCTAGSDPYTATETTISNPLIEANHTIFIDFDDADTPGWVMVGICGWFNADVD